MNFDEASKAIKKGDVLRIRQCLDSGLDPNLSNQYGWTLLMSAANEGNTAVARELIQRGAQLDTRNKHNWTALSLSEESAVRLRQQAKQRQPASPMNSSTAPTL
jgi:ankyrin repeat protein